MANKYTEFSSEQLNQLVAVNDAIDVIIKTLLVKPEYLKNSDLKGMDADEFLYPISPFELADVVADHILKRCPELNIFYPTHIESDNEDYISDTYNG